MSNKNRLRDLATGLNINLYFHQPQTKDLSLAWPQAQQTGKVICQVKTDSATWPQVRVSIYSSTISYGEIRNREFAPGLTTGTVDWKSVMYMSGQTGGGGKGDFGKIRVTGED